MNADDSAAHDAVLRTWLDSGIWIADKPVREALDAVLAENARMREELERLRAARTSLDGQTFGYTVAPPDCLAAAFETRAEESLALANESFDAAVETWPKE